MIELVILAASAVPLARLCAKPPVLRELREHPLYAIAAALLAILFAGLVVWSWRHSLPTLRVLALGSAALALFAWIRARPHYGRSRGLPPGSLGIASSIDSICDEHYYLRQAEKWGPVFKTSQIHRPVVCIVDLQRGFEFLHANGDRLAQSSLPFSRLIPGSYIEFMDGAQHERFRGIFRPALVGVVIDDCRRDVARLVRSALSRLADEEGEQGMDAAGFLDDAVFESLLRVFFGITSDDRRFSTFREMYAGIDFRIASYVRVPRSLERAFERAVVEVHGLIEDMRRRPPDEGDRSVLSEILRSLPEPAAKGEIATVVGNLIFILAVARDDLQGFLLWLLKMNCDRPQYALELRRFDGGGVSAVGERARLATNIVKETLRLRQSEYVYRDVVADCRFGEYRIPKGWLVRLCLTECHRLEDVFPDPHEFDPRRFEERTYSKSEYCPFSDGAHACFGARLAAMIGQVFVQELALGFDWRVVRDGRIERGNRQWHHWKPSSRLRVALTPRAPEHSADKRA